MFIDDTLNEHHALINDLLLGTLLNYAFKLTFSYFFKFCYHLRVFSFFIFYPHRLVSIHKRKLVFLEVMAHCHLSYIEDKTCLRQKLKYLPALWGRSLKLYGISVIY